MTTCKLRHVRIVFVGWYGGNEPSLFVGISIVVVSQVVFTLKLTKLSSQALLVAWYWLGICPTSIDSKLCFKSQSLQNYSWSIDWWVIQNINFFRKNIFFNFIQAVAENYGAHTWKKRTDRRHRQFKRRGVETRRRWKRQITGEPTIIFSNIFKIQES